MSAIRPDCGGIWATGTYGQRQYAGHIQCSPSTRTTRPDCGGTWGTAPLGGRQYAAHRQCFPPRMATRPDCGGIWATGTWGGRYYAGHKQCGYVPPTPPPSNAGGKGRPRVRIHKEDLDDLLLVISLWNLLPRQGASNRRYRYSP